MNDAPRDLMHGINDELLQVVTLMHCLKEEMQELHSDGPADAENMTCPMSRAVYLFGMADAKVREVIMTITPHI